MLASRRLKSYFRIAMRKDLEALLRPLERAKHQRRRAVLRSRFAAASLAILILTVALVLHDGARLWTSLALAACGIGVIGFQLARLTRMPDPLPPEWFVLAIETRLSPQGREALSAMLLAGTCSCDAALAWGRAERARPLGHDEARVPRRHLVGP